MTIYQPIDSINWNRILLTPLEFKSMYKVLPTKGKMAWEYNPLRNYRLSQDMYENNGKLYSKQEVLSKFGISIPDSGSLPDGWSVYQKGELVDFVTDEFKFSLNHPVSIIPFYSYDGSVDLILNDGYNQPRLINSRFSTTGLNTYEVVNRKGDNDTNIYDQGEQFDIDTSLYKRTSKIPKIKFIDSTIGGNLPIGNYHFYFKYSDADGNETDFVAESGLVSVFKGYSTPASISTGQRDENSLKKVQFTVSNIDLSYQYMHVYYTRSSAELNQNMVVSAKKINKNFLVSKSGVCNVIVTGDEDAIDIPITDINLQFNVIKSAKSQCIVQNMLFLANVKKSEIPYEELSDLSLRFLPYLKNKTYPLKMNETYNISSISKGYYDAKFIYNYTGYWDRDLYRLGIVYILKDNTLSPVFNIRGREYVKAFTGQEDEYQDNQYTNYPTFMTNPETNKLERNYIPYNESTFMTIGTEKSVKPGTAKADCLFENVKGVVSLDSLQDTDTIHGFEIRCDNDTINELKKYVKGFFFVRQKRMPLTLCQGITIGVENNSDLPCIPTTQGVTNITYEYTHVETEDKNPDAIHYVMEGFLGRYTYKLKKKSSGFWSKIGKGILAGVVIAAAVVGAAALCYITGGAAAAVIAPLVTAAMVGTGSVMVAVGIAVAAVAATGLAVGAVTSVVAGGQALANVIRQRRNYNKAKNPFRGKDEPIPKGYYREEAEESRKLNASFDQRIILVDDNKVRIGGLLVPDYTVNQHQYNQLFTGEEFIVQNAVSQSTINFTDGGYFKNDNNRHFYIPSYSDFDETYSTTVKLASVPDSCPLVGIDMQKFRARGGDELQVQKFQQAVETYKDDVLNTSSDFIRGNFGPYVAMTGYSGTATTIVNIKIPGYKEGMLLDYIKIRMDDHSEYNAISDRIDISECVPEKKRLIQSTDNKKYVFTLDCYRGDCYLCQFTQRINRNFNDPNAPYNESIVDPKTWKKNYDINELSKIKDINLGDVNAVELGMWVTFRIRSNYNLNIRTVDDSWVDEHAQSGHAREYFPKAPMSTDGSYKIPESHVYNLGFSKSLSERHNFEVPDIPYIKNWFGTRIMYSDINISDGFKNGFRTFKGTAYRDYTREYGEITKILELNSKILIVFEHGLAILDVNERAVAAQATSGNVYITTNNVLPEKPGIISDTFGSQWPDSVIKVPAAPGSPQSIIFGVDTVAKKIWRCDGNTVECISDQRIGEFLNNNITLGERDTEPILGIRNVKTFYNAYKQDVMFTFYDNLSGFHEKVWNICWNQTLQKFITFYSWVPSFMENIDNIPFSFDRTVSKNIAKLGISHKGNSFADGIILSNNILSQSMDNYPGQPANFISELGLTNRILPQGGNVEYKVEFELCRDELRNDRYFYIDDIGDDKQGLFFNLNPSKIKTYSDENKNYSLDSGDQLVKEGNSRGQVYTLGIDGSDYYSAKDLYSEVYYRNVYPDHEYSDWDVNKTTLRSDESKYEYFDRVKNLPIFKNRAGQREMLPDSDQINPDRIVVNINIRANIYVKYSGNNERSLFEAYKDSIDFMQGTSDGSWIKCGYYESQVSLIPDWNLQFLSTDFWKHGQAGLIDIADDIYPTYWYGKQHPFEFEFVACDNPATHKVFTNLEIIANKAQPESFHYEVIGEAYQFAKDKKNMYFRQEAMKALWQYNGLNIEYNPNFLKIDPKLNKSIGNSDFGVSYDFPHNYYARQDVSNEIYDLYKEHTIYNDYIDSTTSLPRNYRNLSGSEIVYYPNRQEFRVWTHAEAVNVDDMQSDDPDTIIRANCQYLEDKWRVQINPIIIVYKNEYDDEWVNAYKSTKKLPRFAIFNSPIPQKIINKGILEYPTKDKNNALYCLYDMPTQYERFGTSNNPAEFPEEVSDHIIDTTRWIDDIGIHDYMWGGDDSACNREELDIRDRFIKIRIRYSGKDLAIIDYLNTIYQESYA